MSYLALIRHSTQAGVPTRAAVRVPVLTTCLQVHPLPQAPVVDVMSRIISAGKIIVGASNTETCDSKCSVIVDIVGAAVVAIVNQLWILSRRAAHSCQW